MASGRLGSAYLGPKRTTQLYSNTSGGAVSLSIMAQAKSSTANTPISIKIDSGTTAAETETQLSTTSYDSETLKLAYNSGITAITGNLEYTNYSTSSNTDLTLFHPSGSGSIGTDRNGYTMPMCTVTSFTDWKGYEATNFFPLWRSGSIAKWATETEAATAGDFTWIGDQLNYNTTSSTSVSRTASFSYNDYGVTADPYHPSRPIVGYNSSCYMTIRYISGSGTDGQNRTSNSVLYELNSSNPGSSNAHTQMLHASGGMMALMHNQTSRALFRYYGLSASSGQLNKMIENSFGGTSSDTPFDMKFALASSTAAGYPSIVFHQYDPYQDKIYTLFNMGSSTMVRKLVEWQPTKLEEIRASGVQAYSSETSGQYLTTDYDRIFNDGLAIDRTSNLPAVMKSNTCMIGAPMKRVQDKLWTVGIRDPYANPSSTYFYKTADFLTWTEITSSDYYNEVYDADTVIASDGTATDKIVSNYSSLPDAGELEHDLSVNNYERTGIVISNGDKVYVRNTGELTGVAVSAMGYEE